MSKPQVVKANNVQDVYNISKLNKSVVEEHNNDHRRNSATITIAASSATVRRDGDREKGVGAGDESADEDKCVDEEQRVGPAPVPMAQSVASVFAPLIRARSCVPEPETEIGSSSVIRARAGASTAAAVVGSRSDLS